MKKFIRAVVIALCLITILSVPVSAATPYQTHTYMATQKQALNSPDAYTPSRQVDGAYMGITFGDGTDLQDLFVDCDQNVYIADKGANAVYVLDSIAGDFVNDNTLTVYIKRLREKLEEDPQNPEIIKTVRGLGYKVEA